VEQKEYTQLDRIQINFQRVLSSATYYRAVSGFSFEFSLAVLKVLVNPEFHPEFTVEEIE